MGWRGRPFGPTIRYVTHRDDRIYKMHQDGMTYKEISDELGLPISTVGDAVRRVRSGGGKSATPLQVANHLARLRKLQDRIERAQEALTEAQADLDAEVLAARAHYVPWSDIASVLGLSVSHLSTRKYGYSSAPRRSLADRKDRW